jgi:hypothetical protein
VLQFVIVLAILAAVVVIVGMPIRRARISRAAGAADPEQARAALHDQPSAVAFNEVAELEAARDAKYREIRDAELDHRTGKLSDGDFETVDRGLRAEAIEILSELDRLRAESHGDEPDTQPSGYPTGSGSANGAGGPTAN